LQKLSKVILFRKKISTMEVSQIQHHCQVLVWEDPMAADALLQDNNRPSTAHVGQSTSIDNLRREWRPWACHVPCCGQSFATGHDLATRLARCRSPGGNEGAYVGSLVNLIQKSADHHKRKDLCEASNNTKQSADGILEFEAAKSEAGKEDIHLFEAEVAETRAGISKVQQEIDNAQASV
jgi:hypothetical protein